jgi:hypothetical protein
MADIHHLLNQFAAEEALLQETQFLAPCVKGGQVQTRVAGLVCTFTPKPRNFEGWGIFKAIDTKTAQLIEEADLPTIATYLEQFPSFRVRLAYKLQHHTWLAYPINEADLRQRWGRVKPIPVHLVMEGQAFEQIMVRWTGQGWWFEDLDRRAEPEVVEQLRSALKQLTPPPDLTFKGLTPELRSLYELVTHQLEGFAQPHRDEQRLKKALHQGGGDLQGFQDQGNYWVVDWTTSDGEHHTSAISKSDLTVVSSGICLSGLDQDFDLQSLVGVIEGQDTD